MGGHTQALRLLDTDRLRGIYLAFRGDVAAFGRDHATDPALVELVDDQFESLAGVHDRLEALNFEVVQILDPQLAVEVADGLRPHALDPRERVHVDGKLRACLLDGLDPARLDVLRDLRRD